MVLESQSCLKTRRTNSLRSKVIINLAMTNLQPCPLHRPVVQLILWIHIRRQIELRFDRTQSTFSYRRQSLRLQPHLFRQFPHNQHPLIRTQSPLPCWPILLTRTAWLRNRTCFRCCFIPMPAIRHPQSPATSALYQAVALCRHKSRPSRFKRLYRADHSTRLLNNRRWANLIRSVNWVS